MPYWWWRKLAENLTDASIKTQHDPLLSRAFDLAREAALLAARYYHRPDADEYR